MMMKWRLLVIALSVLAISCSEATDDAGKDGADPFPTTDVTAGDGVGKSDSSGGDSSAIGDTGEDAASADMGKVVDTGGLDDAPSDTTQIPADALTVDALDQDVTKVDVGAFDVGGGDADEPNPGEDLICAGGDPPTGKGVPFKGLEYSAPSGKTYEFTCTSCPGGIAGLEGKYRYISEKWEIQPNTPQTPLKADIDTIEFDGNWFTFARREPNIGVIDTASGYYFCPDPDELGFAKSDYFNTVFYFDSVQGNTMFNVEPGMANVVHVGGTLDLIETQGVLNWNDQMGGICPGPDCMDYCRIGTMVNGVPCTAPW